MSDEERESDGTGKKEREESNARRPGEGSARRASLLVYDSGLQGAFRFFTLAHFECDGQRKT
jgi:hypothetical protein